MEKYSELFKENGMPCTLCTEINFKNKVIFDGNTYSCTCQQGVNTKTTEYEYLEGSAPINSNEIAITSRMTSGVKGINLAAEDEVIAALPLRHSEDQLALFTTKGYGKKITQSDLTFQKRNGKGLSCYKCNAVNGNLSTAQLISDEDTVLIIGNKNSVCLSAKEIPQYGRPAAGDIVLKNNNILSVSKI